MVSVSSRVSSNDGVDSGGGSGGKRRSASNASMAVPHSSKVIITNLTVSLAITKRKKVMIFTRDTLKFNIAHIGVINCVIFDQNASR